VTRGYVLGLVLFFAIGLRAQSVTSLLSTGDPGNRVDIAVIGDGYTASDRAQFDNDAAAFVQRALAQAPYANYRGLLNVNAVFVASNQSGADHSDRTPQVFRDTAFDAAYNCEGIQRLICVTNSKVIAALSQVLSPSRRDIVVVLVNDTEYGGSGGAVAVTSLHTDATEIVLHELGHSFGLLGDEYTDNPPPCNLTSEPSFANATKETARDKVKWGAWIASTTNLPTTGTTLAVPGLYQGSDYCASGKYRPTADSKMRSLGRGFDQINTEQIIKRYYNLVSPIDSVSPSATTVNMTATESKAFSVATPTIATAFIYSWRVDGILTGTAPTYVANARSLSPGNHILDFQVFDATPLVRTDSNHVLTDTYHWTLVVAPPEIVPSPLANINAATLQSGPLAPDSFVAAQGTGLASGDATAGLVSPVIPYPTSLGGSTVSVKDATGVERLATIYYASATQINYVVPPDTAVGTATVTVASADSALSIGHITVAPVAPGLFMFGGTNIAAARVVRVRNNVQTVEDVYTVNAAGVIVAKPIDLGPPDDVVAILLFGTGIRNRTSLSNLKLSVAGVLIAVDYAGAQSQYPALDQINFTLPRNLIGKGDVVIQMTVDNLPANPVHLTIQ
jgi:uncharacterized protein (TIGR03437 family)